ncbi:MAG: hypothetical protein AMQ74_01906 [Candidatus Methanofastidiosum methylothiophilum]|uniref:Peptidase family M50 n=1 Tax=Candidatus Methanofastidiosum methylothiophilum TaxID=1705564 RepID=A0A150IJZ1_9EURY|nr:MAG: hypothetical protein AMQ74_01906 [Candidatus Methanofastidiosum methylthiophilus]
MESVLICLGTTFIGYVLGTVWHELAHIFIAYLVRLELTDVSIHFTKGYTEEIRLDWDTKKYDKNVAKKLIITGVAPWSILILIPIGAYCLYHGILNLNFSMMTDGVLLSIMVLSALIPTEVDRKIVLEVYRWYRKNGKPKELKIMLNEEDK